MMSKSRRSDVLGHFLVRNALFFDDFAYYDREYLGLDSGLSAEKILLALKWAN